MRYGLTSVSSPTGSRCSPRHRTRSAATSGSRTDGRRADRGWLTHTSGALPNLGVLAAFVPLVVLGNLAGRPIFSRLAGGDAYEPVLTGTLVLAVVAGLATSIL